MVVWLSWLSGKALASQPRQCHQMLSAHVTNPLCVLCHASERFNCLCKGRPQTIFQNDVIVTLSWNPPITSHLLCPLQEMKYEIQDTVYREINSLKS